MPPRHVTTLLKSPSHPMADAVPPAPVNASVATLKSHRYAGSGPPGVVVPGLGAFEGTAVGSGMELAPADSIDPADHGPRPARGPSPSAASPKGALGRATALTIGWTRMVLARPGRGPMVPAVRGPRAEHWPGPWPWPTRAPSAWGQKPGMQAHVPLAGERNRKGAAQCVERGQVQNDSAFGG